MENKKLIKILLKDFADLEELISENKNGNFNALEMEFLTSRVKGAGRLLHLLSDSLMLEIIHEEKVKTQTFETVDFSPATESELPPITLPASMPVARELIIHKEQEVVNTKIVQEIPKKVEVTVKEEVPVRKPVLDEKPEKAEEIKREPEVEVKVNAVTKPVKSESQQRLGDTFTKEKSVNELLAEQNKLEFKLSNLPVPNIQNAIGINDKFLFIRELFDGDAEKFSSTVAILDSMTGITHAVEYLQENFKWKKTDASLKFVNLVKRRFPG